MASAWPKALQLQAESVAIWGRKEEKNAEALEKLEAYGTAKTGLNGLVRALADPSLTFHTGLWKSAWMAATRCP